MKETMSPTTMTVKQPKAEYHMYDILNTSEFQIEGLKRMCASLISQSYAAYGWIYVYDWSCHLVKNM